MAEQEEMALNCARRGLDLILGKKSVLNGQTLEYVGQRGGEATIPGSVKKTPVNIALWDIL